MPNQRTYQALSQGAWSGRMIFTAIFFLAISSLAYGQQAYYHLIVSSKATLAEADAAAKAYKVPGMTLSPTILFPAEGEKWYRVSAYQSTQRPEVENISRQLVAKGKPKGWILTLNAGQRGAASPAAGTASTARREASQAAPASASGNVRYHLIVGSHPSYEVAQTQVDQLTAKGMEPYVVFPMGEVSAFRVSVFNSANKREIDAYATRLRQRYPSMSNWILEEQATSSTLNPALSQRVSRPAAAATGTTYYLIGGNFARYDQASDFAEASRAYGANPRILVPDQGQQGNFRVSLWESANKTEVEAYQQQLVQRGLPGGWILAK